MGDTGSSSNRDNSSSANALSRGGRSRGGPSRAAVLPVASGQAARIRHLLATDHTLGEVLQAEQERWPGRLEQLVDEFGAGTVAGFQRYLQGVLGEEDAPTKEALYSYLRDEPSRPSARIFLFISLATGCNPYWLGFGLEPRQQPGEGKFFYAEVAGGSSQVRALPVADGQAAHIQYLLEEGRTFGEVLRTEHASWPSRLRRLVDEFGRGTAGFRRYLQSVLGVGSVPTEPTLLSYQRDEPRRPLAPTFLSMTLATGTNPYWLAFGFGQEQQPGELGEAGDAGEDELVDLLKASTEPRASAKRAGGPSDFVQSDLIQIPMVRLSRGRLVETEEPPFVALRRYLPAGPWVLEASKNHRLRMFHLPHDLMQGERGPGTRAGAPPAASLWLVGWFGAEQVDERKAAEGVQTAASGMSLGRLARALRLTSGEYLVRLGAPFEVPALLALVSLDPSPSFEALTCVLRQLYVSPYPRRMTQAERDALPDPAAVEAFYEELGRRPVGLAVASGMFTASFGTPQEVRVLLDEVRATRVLLQGMGPVTL